MIESGSGFRREHDRSHLKPLTTVRFFAALLVVVYHASDTFSGSLLFRWPDPIVHFVNSGFVGVSVFFILSGFILSYNYLHTDLSAPAQRADFWISRLARIYPVYLLGLVVAAPKFFYGLLQEGLGALITSFPLVGVPVLTLTQSWVPSLATAWNPPAWSLSAEAFFYLVFPFVAVRVAKWNGGRAALVAMALCWLAALVAPACYYLFAPGAPGWGNFLKFNPLLRLPEFLMGICLCQLFLHGNRVEPWRRAGARLAVAAGLAGLALCYSHLVPTYLVYDGLLDPLFALFIFSLAMASLRPGPVVRFLSGPVFILLGEASYALYILHVPIRKLMEGVLGRIFPSTLEDPLVASGVFLLYLVVTLGVSILAFRFLEVPARRWVKERFRARKARARTDRPDSGLEPLGGQWVSEGAKQS